MKSSSGAHFVALDHVRALAALLVFVWHFTHGRAGYPVPFEGAPIWGPLALFDEGHVGVALFMTLSGYLFAKLLDGKSVNYRYFLLNRVLRLFPLLIVVILAVTAIRAIEANDFRVAYWNLLAIPKGLVLPTWPNGGWSITTELHFYLLLPFLLALKNRAAAALALVIVSAMAFRTYLFMQAGEVQSLAYWTIVGRIDQFVLGILAFHFGGLFRSRHLLAAAVFLCLISTYHQFDVGGGFYLTGGYPSPSTIWIWLPTLEGAAFGALIAWYDTSFEHRSTRMSQAIARIGEYSYSIYLLHFFVVFWAADFIHRNVVDLSSFYVAFPVSLVVFATLIPFSYLSMRYIEAPCLRFRRPYIRSPRQAQSPAAPAYSQTNSAR